MQKNLNEARELSLSFLYWLQTETPRDEGGYGYPELKPWPFIFDTTDGRAKKLTSVSQGVS
ncbi:MAG: hypothetical protein BSOLF_1694 [Candidatus Carbobacillus altaicus]|uniref:Uncharacterized protein n=1 Tax=Candidatus Carbonibacillus altaicus TaxID=2163959 RepID=A0A2R6Y3Z5_9BACL|nr:MAG: hypothetical protein BSOLF_1694 [Candidatus Carbobacillus altaicus]